MLLAIVIRMFAIFAASFVVGVAAILIVVWFTFQPASLPEPAVAVPPPAAEPAQEPPAIEPLPPVDPRPVRSWAPPPSAPWCARLSKKIKSVPG
jgi:hypothetical protein